MRKLRTLDKVAYIRFASVYMEFEDLRRFEEELEDGDVSIKNKGVTLIVDPLSIQYLMGAEVDFEVTLQAAQFIVHNPNAKSTCDCGSSLSV